MQFSFRSLSKYVRNIIFGTLLWILVPEKGKHVCTFLTIDQGSLFHQELTIRSSYFKLKLFPRIEDLPIQFLQ